VSVTPGSGLTYTSLIPTQIKVIGYKGLHLEMWLYLRIWKAKSHFEYITPNFLQVFCDICNCTLATELTQI